MAMKYDKAQVDALLAGNGDPLAQQWLAGESVDLSSVDGAVALAAIEAAVQQQNTALLQSLDKGPKLLRKAARRGLHKLKSQGVEVSEAPSKAFGLAAAPIDPEPTALMGPADADGYSEFMVAWTDHEGTCILMGRCGGAEGLRDLSHGHSSRGELRRMVREMKSEAPWIAQLPFEQAMQFIMPAVDKAQSLTGGLPHDWEHFAGHVPAEVLEAGKSGPQTPELQVEEGMLDGSSALAGHPWFNLWPVEQSLVEKMVRSLAEVMEAPDTDEPTDGEVTDMTQVLSDMAAEGLDDPEVRAEWQRRAALAYAAATARGEDFAAQMATHLQAALAQGVSARQIPLVERNLQLTLGYMAQQGREQA